MYISKTDFIQFIRCPKMFWLKKHRPELSEEMNAAARVNIEEGNKIGELALKYPDFKGGKYIDWKGYEKTLEETKKLLKDNDIIYEASFSSILGGEKFFFRSDILVKQDDKYDLIEVKSASKVKEHFYWDLAFQAFILTQNGLSFNRLILMHSNRSYIRGKKLALKEFFILEDITEEVENEYLPHVENILEKMVATYNKENKPSRILGSHCKRPYTCAFRKYCYRNIDNNSVEHLSRLSESKRKTFRRLGIKNFEHLDNNLKMLDKGAHDFKFLTDKQQKQLDVYKSKKPYVNKEKLKDFISQIKYPIYYLDFEAYNKAIPPYIGMKPNDFLVFQISLHKEYEKGDIEHFEFLETTIGDPREKVIKFLINNLKDRGSIVVYNKNFEEQRIRELIEYFPKYEDELDNIIDRMVDLEVPFNKHYYKHEFKGRSSIKVVLPAMVPDLSYDGLNIKDGADAQAIYRNLLDGVYKNDYKQKIKDLLDYCKMDTWAMVELLKALKKEIE